LRSMRLGATSEGGFRASVGGTFQINDRLSTKARKCPHLRAFQNSRRLPKAKVWAS
jgi:hypothetical protein